LEKWEEEARNDMYEIDRILGKFWVDGWMSSDTKQKILNEFPPRLKNLLIG
jgi:hypothetical protein